MQVSTQCKVAADVDADQRRCRCSDPLDEFQDCGLVFGNGGVLGDLAGVDETAYRQPCAAPAGKADRDSVHPQ